MNINILKRNVIFKKAYFLFFIHNLIKTVIIYLFIKNIMHRQDAIYLDQLCPKINNKSWRESLHKLTKYKCIYCGKPSESLDHLHPMSKGGTSITSNCVPCCLSCNGKKSDSEVLSWYRKQNFYDPRRAMAIRAWFNDDLKLASVLLNYLD